MRPPNIFTIAPGAPFLATFARALCGGQIIPGVDGADPMAFAKTTIYVPTRRAARALAQELALALDAPAVLLPRIRPLGGLEETERGLLFADLPDPLALPQPIGDIARRMILAELVLNWGRALKHAIVRMDAAGNAETDPLEAMMVATHFAGAWHLAGDLAGLIDEMIIEDVAWRNLDDLGANFDEYWRITMNFLNIAINAWPEILKGRQAVDPARHHIQLVEAQIAQLELGQSTGPVIAIGSTGTNRATARLLAAISRAKQGAIVLPGLDHTLDAAAFALIGGDEMAGLEPASSHPQAALRRLLPVLGMERGEVWELAALSPAMQARQMLVSQALRPADSTEIWSDFIARAGSDIPLALEGINLIEAGDEREEALAIAIALRQTLETPLATAALVTPNRDLAARVRAELLRWQIVVDDSGGTSFGATPFGTLARLVLACAQSGQGALDTIALLAHPLVRLGYPRETVAQLAPLVETGILRTVLPNFGLGQAAQKVQAARLRAGDRHANIAQKRISEAQWDGIEALLTAFEAAMAPLASLAEEASLAQWVGAHRKSLVALTTGAAGEPAQDGPDAEKLAELLDELAAASTSTIDFTCAGYASFFEMLAKEAIVRGPVRAHPRLKILGLLEARLMHADTLVLAGLDETVWPPQGRTDAFLNRPMRTRLGLSSPERRIGQTAHDFTQGMGCERVILTRCAKRAGSPMVASRFLLRMAALAGPHWDACRVRGNYWLQLARDIDVPRHIRPPQKPKPRPPLHLRPLGLSVTQIETLRRDPYAIFARKILELSPLDPLGVEMGAREKGLLLHEVIAAFCKLHPFGPLPPDSAAKLLQMTQAAMQPLLENAGFRAFQWPQVEKSLQFYLRFEAERRGQIASVLAEIGGTMTITLDDGSSFLLGCIADRLEIGKDGAVTVVDFKSGVPPSIAEVQAGFAPQLTLEAVMVDCGCFALPEGALATAAMYVKLGGGEDGGKQIDLRFQSASFEEVKADHYDRLHGLLNQFRNPQTPYLSKPHAKFMARFSDYDHLARVKEWSSLPGGDTA